jgi:hypothetical protein
MLQNIKISATYKIYTGRLMGMSRKNKRLFSVVTIVIIAVAVLCVMCFFVGSSVFPAYLQLDINDVPIYSQQRVELNPVPPLYFQQGETLQIDVISLRQLSLKLNPLFMVPARGVEGRFELPDGFFTVDSLQSQVIPFGSIYPGDASHFGSLLITVEDNVAPGTYHAKFVYWGKNVQTQEIDIELIVNSR